MSTPDDGEETSAAAATEFAEAHLKTGWMRPHMASAVFTPIGFGSTKSHATSSCKLKTAARNRSVLRLRARLASLHTGAHYNPRLISFAVTPLICTNV